MTTTDAAAAPAVRSYRRTDFGEHVARTVANLQARAVRDVPIPEAIGALARLRRGIGRTPGFDYTLEKYVGVPDALVGPRPDDDSVPADREYAAHDAVTLYALHQQSQRKPMHVNGRGLGYAMADLVKASGSPEGVRRRFAALGTAANYSETIFHLRSLVTMLREQQIALDYGRLAENLNALRRPGGRADVQAIWGREYFRITATRDAQDSTGTDSAPDTDSTSDTEETAS